MSILSDPTCFYLVPSEEDIFATVARWDQSVREGLTAQMHSTGVELNPGVLLALESFMHELTVRSSSYGSAGLS